jgi:hypothetical protein
MKLITIAHLLVVLVAQLAHVHSLAQPQPHQRPQSTTSSGSKARAAPHAGPSILTLGEFHTDELPRNLGSGWLALRHEAGVWKLVPTLVRTRRVHDAVMDADGQATGRAVVAQPPGSPGMVLLRHASLKPGVVAPGHWQSKDFVMADGAMPIEAQHPIDFRFQGRSYSLGVRGKTDSPEQFASLSLRTPQGDVVVAKPFVLSENSSLHWVGDLDRDGHPDLVVDVSGHYNAGMLCLFLSGGSAIRLRRVDCLSSTGC